MWTRRTIEAVLEDAPRAANQIQDRPQLAQQIGVQLLDRAARLLRDEGTWTEARLSAYQALETSARVRAWADGSIRAEIKPQLDAMLTELRDRAELPWWFPTWATAAPNWNTPGTPLNRWTFDPPRGSTIADPPRSLDLLTIAKFSIGALALVLILGLCVAIVRMFR